MLASLTDIGSLDFLVRGLAEKPAKGMYLSQFRILRFYVAWVQPILNHRILRLKYSLINTALSTLERSHAHFVFPTHPSCIYFIFLSISECFLNYETRTLASIHDVKNRGNIR